VAESIPSSIGALTDRRSLKFASGLGRRHRPNRDRNRPRPRRGFSCVSLTRTPAAVLLALALTSSLAPSEQVSGVALPLQPVGANFVNADKEYLLADNSCEGEPAGASPCLAFGSQGTEGYMGVSGSSPCRALLRARGGSQASGCLGEPGRLRQPPRRLPVQPGTTKDRARQPGCLAQIMYACQLGERAPVPVIWFDSYSKSYIFLDDHSGAFCVPAQSPVLRTGVLSTGRQPLLRGRTTGSRGPTPCRYRPDVPPGQAWLGSS